MTARTATRPLSQYGVHRFSLQSDVCTFFQGKTVPVPVALLQGDIWGKVKVKSKVIPVTGRGGP
jgi:hypothetical protein